MTDKIRIEENNHVATITLCRAKKLNAIDPDMLDGLGRVVTDIHSNNQVRAVVITGEGPRAFSAGADIKAWSELEALDMWRSWIPLGNRVMRQIAQLPQAVIAAINGLAFGGGLELALACDIRVATETAQFGMPEVSIATVPGWGGTFRLPAIVGTARAKSMILTGQRIDAATAQVWGLITAITPDGQVLQRAQAMANQIASNAPLAIRMAKQLLDRKDAPEHMEALAGALSAHSTDGREGLLSFTEKRSPKYIGR